MMKLLNILQHQLLVSEIGPCNESAYFPSPKKLKKLWG